MFAQNETYLDASTHDSDGSAAELSQVRRDVHGLLHAAVHAADAAGDEDRDADKRCEVGSGCNGGGAVTLLCNNDSQVAARAFADFGAENGEFLQSRLVEADVDDTVQESDGGGGGTLRSHDLFDFDSGLKVIGVFHAVGDNSGLECNNGAVFLHSSGDFGGKDHGNLGLG